MKSRRQGTSALRAWSRFIAGPAVVASTLQVATSAFATGLDANADREARPQVQPAPAAPPTFYVAAFAATTLVYRPYGGSFLGPQGDVSPIVGFGYFLTEQIALELDVGATFAAGDYVSTSLTPGIVWAFHPNVYLAGRFIVPIHPEINLALYPGIGGTYAFGPLSPFLELNVLSTIGRGEPDLGLGGSAGALYSF